MSKERKSPRPGKPEANPNAADDNTVPPGRRLCWVPCTQTFPQDVASQLRRRREASQRLVRLADCCGARDPLECRCHDPRPQLSERAIEAWRAAIERTLPIGPPVVPLEVLQRMYRNGGSDRQLAERVWAETGGLVA
jgi:hypothetical protein